MVVLPSYFLDCYDMEIMTLGAVELGDENLMLQTRYWDLILCVRVSGVIRVSVVCTYREHPWRLIRASASVVK
jgi:hypothetical protein